MIDLTNNLNTSYFQTSSNLVFRPYYQGGLATNMVQIPVVAWIYNRSDGTQDFPFTTIEVEMAIKETNRIFEMNGVNVRLYLHCLPRFINSSFFYQGMSNTSQSLELFHNNWEKSALNIHFIRYTSIGAGLAILPSISPIMNGRYNAFVRYTRNNQERMLYNEFILTFIHEVGHTFGLFHTHHRARLLGNLSGTSNALADACGQEYVDRNRRLRWQQGCFFWDNVTACDRNGDFLCDTDADPNAGTAVTVPCDNVTGNITYDWKTGIDGNNWYRKDNDGVEWYSNGRSNALRNVMSYASDNLGCKNQITPMQRGIIYEYTLARHLRGETSFPSRFYQNDIDVYEGDNVWKNRFLGSLILTESISQRNNRIDINSRQYHTLHWMPDNSPQGFLQCNDQDWVFFDITSAGQYTLQTAPVPNQNQPNTNIALFFVDINGDLSNSPIDFSDDISTTNKFSRISRNLSIGRYAIKVTASSIYPAQDSKGHYFLEIGCIPLPVDFGEVTGGNLACGTQVFSLNGGVPAGVPSVSWTLTPANLFAISSGSGTSVTPQIIGSGQGTVTFFLNTLCGNVEFAKKDFWVGIPPAPKLSILYGGRQIIQEPLVAPPDGFVCYRGSTRFKADNLQLNAGVTSFEWIIGCGNVVQTLNVLNSSTRGVVWFDIGSCTETIVRVRARNICGVSAWTDLPLTFMECQMMRSALQDSSSSEIIISPNPTSNFSTIDLSKSEQVYQIQLSDLQGKFLFSDKTNEEKYKLDLKNYPSGIYLLHLNNGEKTTIHKIIKQ